MYNEPVMLHQF